MSRGDNVKLLNEPEEAPQQLAYPRTNIQFGPLGTWFAVHIQLADDIAIVKMFDARAEEELCNHLLQRRKELRQQIEMAQNIQNSKLH